MTNAARPLLLCLLLGLSAPALAAQVMPSKQPETPPAATAEKSTKAAKLSAKDQADIARIEAYLNNLKSVGARFTQVSETGAVRGGAIAIERPGKMRVTYEEPDKDFIVADGSFIHMWDDEMQQQSTLPLGEGIAELILRNTIKLSGDIVVTRLERFPAKLEITLLSAKEPTQGALTLIFEDKPLKLRQWRVLDPQGRTTGVNLDSAQEGITFPEGTFTFVSPRLAKPYPQNPG